MKLYICSTCHQHFTELNCPHCVQKTPTQAPRIALALLLGLGLTGCGEKDEDTADATEEPSAEPEMAALYGVEENPEE